MSRRVWALPFVLLTLPARAQTLTPIASLEDARAMCASADPARFYTVTLPARGFTLAPYDAPRARLAVDASRGLRAAEEGALELVLHHIAGLGAGREGDLDIAIPTSAADAAALRAAHARGELGLKLTFQLAQPGDGSAVCAAVVRADGEGMRAAVEPAAFEILRDGAPLASGESSRFGAARESARPAAVAAPRVVVSPPMLTSAGGRASPRVARTASALAPRLLDCYRQGLSDDPTLRGPFVAGLDLAADGRVTSARAELDGLGAPAVAGCVLRVVRAARFPSGADRLSIPIRFSD